MKVPSWFRDRALRKVAKYGLPVALGKITTAAAGLITMALLAHYLGPGPFGLIALFRTVITVVDLFANFNTWQAIVKYGAEAIAENRRDDLKRIIKLAFVIDATTATVGACVVVGIAFLIPARFSWTWHEAALCAFYALTLVSKVAGTTDGIFRICDAYRAQAIVASVMSFIMTSFVAIAVATHASFDGCVLALVSGEVLANLAVSATAFWVANKAGYGGWWKLPVRGVTKVFPGIRRFLVATNAQLTVRTFQGELDMLVVGSMLGKTPAGHFRVIKQLGTIPGRVFNPFEQVLFTELARCAATRDYAGFRNLLKRTVLVAGTGSLCIWVIAAVGARPLIQLVAGDAFVAAAPAFRWYLLAMILHVIGMPFMRAMIALGRPGTLLMFDIASLVVLVTASIISTWLWGLVGLACAIVVHKSVQIAWSTTFIWRFLHNAEAKSGINEPLSP